MQTDSFAGMFDQNADQWARQEPLILSDFTARPLVLQELAPVEATHMLDLGCGEGPLPSSSGASRRSVGFRHRYLQRNGRACTTGRERCAVPDDFRERQCHEFSGFSTQAIRPGDRRVHAQLFELR